MCVPPVPVCALHVRPDCSDRQRLHAARLPRLGKQQRQRRASGGSCRSGVPAVRGVRVREYAERCGRRAAVHGVGAAAGARGTGRDVCRADRRVAAGITAHHWTIG